MDRPKARVTKKKRGSNKQLNDAAISLEDVNKSECTPIFPIEAWEEAIAAKQLLTALLLEASMNQRERTVLEQRFVRGWTLAKCGEFWGRSRARIRQIEVGALRKLRGSAVRLVKSQRVSIEDFGWRHTGGYDQWTFEPICVYSQKKSKRECVSIKQHKYPSWGQERAIINKVIASMGVI